eukprot:921744_1
MSENSNPRKRRKRGNELGGIWPRLFAVGAFAWALYLRKGGASPSQISPNSRHKSKSDRNQKKPENSTSRPRPVLQPEATAQPEPPNTDLTDFQIDSSKFSKPLKDLSQIELRQLAGHNLGRIFDESRGGIKWANEEIGFVLAVNREGVAVQDIAFAVNRTRNSLFVKMKRVMSAEYCTTASEGVRKRRYYDPPMSERVRIVGRDLPNHKGTTKDIFDLIDAKYRDMDRSPAPGDKNSFSGTQRVSNACGTSPWFCKIGKVGKQALWQYQETEDQKGMTKAFDESMKP